MQVNRRIIGSRNASTWKRASIYSAGQRRRRFCAKVSHSLILFQCRSNRKLGKEIQFWAISIFKVHYTSCITVNGRIDISFWGTDYCTNTKQKRYVGTNSLFWKQFWFAQDKHPFNFYDVRAAVATAQEDKQPKAKTNLFPFTLEVPDRKKKHVTTHYFAADSEEQRSSWIALINKEARLNNSNKVFGVALEDVRERDENGVPLFLSAMLTFLQTTGNNILKLYNTNDFS